MLERKWDGEVSSLLGLRLKPKGSGIHAQPCQFSIHICTFFTSNRFIQTQETFWADDNEFEKLNLPLLYPIYDQAGLTIFCNMAGSS